MRRSGRTVAARSVPAVDGAAGPVCGGAPSAGLVGSLEVALEGEVAPAYAVGDLVVGDGLFWLPMPAPGGPWSAADDEVAGSGLGARGVARK
jgi:hypothetical protein